MNNELPPLAVALMTVTGRLRGMSHDPVFVVLLGVLLLIGMFSRAWWFVPLASLALPGFIYYRNWDWWQEMGLHRGPSDFLVHAGIVCLAFSAAYGVGRLVSYPFRRKP